ncbi:hypothetical protein GCM10008106_37160 [Mongoliitalea lutea]|uniref:Uncharacterized protein n=1 Tax=Mongoliitalea lutea TaxID=849756 RepID=A0A8J3D2G9_9BACT|nr:hypothetical protein GCM10008106_37160 [Mongoliitalea lutea]
MIITPIHSNRSLFLATDFIPFYFTIEQINSCTALKAKLLVTLERLKYKMDFKINQCEKKLNV